MSDLFSKYDKEKAISLEYDGDKNNNKIPDLDEIGINYLSGDGDFRSKESIKLLEESEHCGNKSTFFIIQRICSAII